MPKKKGRKKPKKLTNKKSASEAPTPMPSLVFNEVLFDSPSGSADKKATKFESANQSKLNQSNFAPETVAKRWLWIGVTSLAAIIFIFWIWSFTSRLSELSWGNTPEQQLLAKNKSNWDSIFSETKQSEEAISRTKKELKEIIGQLLTANATTTPSASTTASTTP